MKNLFCILKYFVNCVFGGLDDEVFIDWLKLKGLILDVLELIFVHTNEHQMNTKVSWNK